MRIELGLQVSELIGRDLVSFGVAEQAIAASDDVADVKSDGGKIVRPIVELLIRKLRAPALDVFQRKLEGVKNRAL
jgi:hypothetical protein